MAPEDDAVPGDVAQPGERATETVVHVACHVVGREGVARCGRLPADRPWWRDRPDDLDQGGDGLDGRVPSRRTGVLDGGDTGFPWVDAVPHRAHCEDERLRSVGRAGRTIDTGHVRDLEEARITGGVRPGRTVHDDDRAGVVHEDVLGAQVAEDERTAGRERGQVEQGQRQRHGHARRQHADAVECIGQCDAGQLGGAGHQASVAVPTHGGDRHEVVGGDRAAVGEPARGVRLGPRAAPPHGGPGPRLLPRLHANQRGGGEHGLQAGRARLWTVAVRPQPRDGRCSGGRPGRILGRWQAGAPQARQRRNPAVSSRCTRSSP